MLNNKIETELHMSSINQYPFHSRLVKARLQNKQKTMAKPQFRPQQAHDSSTWTCRIATQV